MYLTVQEVESLFMMGDAVGSGQDIFGLRRAPLNLIMKKKHPRKTPWGEEPGKDLIEEVAPRNLMTMLLSVRYEIRIFKSQAGTFMS